MFKFLTDALIIFFNTFYIITNKTIYNTNHWFKFKYYLVFYTNFSTYFYLIWGYVTNLYNCKSSLYALILILFAWRYFLYALWLKLGFVIL